MKYLFLIILSLLIFPSSVLARSSDFFPLGMFEDGNRMNTSTGFEAMITDLRAHNLDTVLFTNNSNASHLPILSVSDRLGFNVIWGGPMHELSNNWFDNPVAATPQNAEAIIGPLVDQLKTHSSVKGYNLIDDTTLSKADKLKLAIDVYKAHDTNNSATAVFVGGHEKAYTTSGSDTFLTYYYPAKAHKTSCDWNFISPTQNDFSLVLRNVSRNKDQGVPLWTILQTHGSYPTYDPAAEVTALRNPTVDEVSLQHWIAIGEGSKGMFWFIYSTQQWWTGLHDSPALFERISEVSARTKPLTPLLIKLEKTADYFNLNGGGNRYVSTMIDPYTGKYYVLVANGVCGATQQVAITSSIFSGNLKNIETGVLVGINSSISLNPGDGQIFEVVNSTVTIPSPQPSVNLFTNPSFETKIGSFAANWGAQPSSSVDSTVKHLGSNSFKLTGAANVYVNQKLNLKPATLYTVSYWVKSPTGMTANGVTFRAVSSDTLTPVTGASTMNGSAFEWKQVKDTFYTSTTYVDSRFDLMWDLKAGETAYIDDVNICEGKDCLPKQVQMQQQTPAPSAGKPGDIILNGSVDIFDYNELLRQFGQTGSALTADLEKSGTSANKVDIYDYNTFLSLFGS